MTHQDQAAFSRVCPSCGRRVPRNVSSCRCGAALPVDTATVAAAEPLPETPGGGGMNLAIVVFVAIAAIGAAGYWTWKTPPARIEVRPVAESAQPGANGASEARTASAAARAWDAAANAKEIPAASANPADPPKATPLSAPPASIEEMVDRVMPAVVLIETSSGRGSGFFVNRDTLITNVHVVQNDSFVTLRRMDGSTIQARVDSRAPAFDIAILKITQPSASQAVIAMASAHSLRPGQEIIVIGSALGTLQNSVSRGIVSGLRTSGGATLVQTDAAVNPGNSGGPMLDHNGAVIAITTMGYKNAEGLNFGVAIDHARDLLEGRQTNVGSTGGLADIQSQARGSESDRQQQQGDQQFRARIGQMAQAAQRVDNDWQYFRTQCYKSAIGGNYDREWFAVLVPRGVPGDAAAGCVQFYKEFEGNVRRFKDVMQQALGDARRANVMPGTMREVLRSNRLDFEWER